MAGTFILFNDCLVLLKINPKNVDLSCIYGGSRVLGLFGLGEGGREDVGSQCYK